jgi:hypothetical protein
MTPAIFLTIASVSLGAAAMIVLAARAGLRPADAFLLSFDTMASRSKQGWIAFWSKDPFIAAQRKRKGPAFATYDVPGGGTLPVHFAVSDLRHHTLVLGGTGTGKSSLLETLAVHRLRVGEPFALVDLHGDLFTRVARWASVLETPHVTLLDFTKPETLPSFNPLVPLSGIDTGRQVDLIVGTLKRLYASEDAASWAWGVKVEELMRHALTAALEARKNAGVVFSIADLPQFFLLPEVRKGIVEHASPESRGYFTKRYGAREEMYVSAVLNKLEPFLGSVAVQRFLGRSDSTVDLFGAMERGETILINLAKGYMPAADVMGRLLVNIFQTAALRRERLRPEVRRPYSLLLDEAHLLAGAGSGLEDFLVAARKYKVFVTLAAQGLSLFPASFRPHLASESTVELAEAIKVQSGTLYYFRSLHRPFSRAPKAVPATARPSARASPASPETTTRLPRVRPYCSSQRPEMRRLGTGASPLRARWLARKSVVMLSSRAPPLPPRREGRGGWRSVGSVFRLIVPLRPSVDHRMDVRRRHAMRGDAEDRGLRLRCCGIGPPRHPATRLLSRRGLLRDRRAGRSAAVRRWDERKLRPGQRLRESGHFLRQPFGMHGHEIAQLAREDSADGLAVEGRKPLQRHDFHARDAHLQVGEPQQLRQRLGQLRAEGLFDHLLRPEVHPERNQLRPRQDQPLVGLDPLHFARFHPPAQLAPVHLQQCCRFADGVGGFRVEEEGADVVRGGGHRLSPDLSFWYWRQASLKRIQLKPSCPWSGGVYS